MYEKIKSQLKEDVGTSRLQHSLRVLEVAQSLGGIYGADLEKVSLAALLHDCAKLEDKNNLLKRAYDFDIILDEIMLNNCELIHGPLGAKIAEEKYNIKDQEILNAIEFHTTGRENMSLVEKIVFIADYIEPKRNFLGVEEVRELAFKDLDSSIILSIEQNIKFLIDKGRLISINTIKARNYLKMIKLKEGSNNE